MSITELKEKTVKDLQSDLLEKRQELLRLRIQKVAGELKQNHLFKEVRRQIARIKTILCEKEGSV